MNKTLAVDCKASADKLYDFLIKKQIAENGSLVGYDSGTRFNLRLWRFLKSYTRFINYKDIKYYAQAQAYWINSNADMFSLTNDKTYLDNIKRCANVLLKTQTLDGYWVLSNREWKGRITTVEGCFGGLGLLTAYKLTNDYRYLTGALASYEYLVNTCGFLNYDKSSICINYFSNHPTGLVPNNATLALWFFTELYKTTNDTKFLHYCPGLSEFLVKCQLKNGELPYALKYEDRQLEDRPHYLCFQYNAFEFMDLVHYYDNTNDEKIKPVLEKMASFLSTGLTDAGDARHNCFEDLPTMNYFTGAISAALLIASDRGIGNYHDVAAKGYKRLISKQNQDGSFDYSSGDYKYFSDKRPYARNLAMILKHLLIGADKL